MSRAVFRAFVVMLCLWVVAAPVHGEGLSADRVVVVVNANDPASIRVADYYMAVRRVPEHHRVNVSLPVGGTDIDRATYERRVLQPVRQHIESQGLKQQACCVLLSYGLPLRIDNEPLNNADMREVQTLRETSQSLREAIAEQAAIIERIGRDGHTSQPLPEGAVALTAHLQKQVVAAYERIKTLEDERRRPAATELWRRQGALFGPVALMQRIESAGVDNARLARMRRHVDGVRLAMDRLSRDHRPEARREHQRLRGEYFGLVGAWTGAQADLQQLKQPVGAALDSELSLLWWGGAARRGRIVNTASYPYTHVRHRLDEPRVLITARLHASDEQTTIRMIADAVAVERTGLRGNAYLDARGIEDPSFARYDRSLVALGERLRSNRSIEKVVVDHNEALMPTRSGDNAALYCGWYGLRKYNRPVTLMRGAVAWHIASYEATDFSPDSKEWAVNLLRDGAAVTLGAVAEPYLDAFPLPDDFFQLLLTGRYTVGEVYLMTKRYASWQMTLVGDPLYNPYKSRPALRVSDVRLARPIMPDVDDGAAALAGALVDVPIGE